MSATFIRSGWRACSRGFIGRIGCRRRKGDRVRSADLPAYGTSPSLIQSSDRCSRAGSCVDLNQRQPRGATYSGTSITKMRIGMDDIINSKGLSDFRCWPGKPESEEINSLLQPYSQGTGRELAIVSLKRTFLAH